MECFAWSDYNTTVTFPTNTALSGTTQRWAINGAYSTAALTTGGSLSQIYYHQFNDGLSYSLVGSGSSTAPTFTANQFGASTPLSLTTTSSNAWLDAGASWTASPNPLTGSSSSERWDTNQANGTLSSSAVTTVALPYYHQFTITFGYSDQDSIAVTSGSKIGFYYQFGTQINIAAGSSYGLSSPASTWVDAGSNMVSYQTFTSGTQQWALSISPASFTVSSSVTITDSNFYHQYQVSSKYTISDGSTPSSGVTLSGTQFGLALPTTNLGTTAQNIWLDAGSGWSVNNPIPISPTTERWQAQSGTSGTVASGTTINPTYYHQFQVSAIYSTQDGSTPSANVILSGTQFGSNSYTLTLTKSAQTTWLDAGSGWSVNNPIPISPTTERWQAQSGTSGTVASGTTINPTYHHQYQLTVVSTYDTPTGAGWYDVDSSATFGVTSPSSGGTGTQYVLLSWTGSGTGSYSGLSRLLR